MMLLVPSIDEIAWRLYDTESPLNPWRVYFASWLPLISGFVISSAMMDGFQQAYLLRIILAD
jgi:hypothetical protein